MPRVLGAAAGPQVAGDGFLGRAPGPVESGRMTRRSLEMTSVAGQNRTSTRVVQVRTGGWEYRSYAAVTSGPAALTSGSIPG